MLKYKVFIFVLLTAFFMTANAYSQQDIKDQQINTIEGQVTYVDLEGNVVGVKTEKGMMVFDISVESVLMRYAHRISIIEVEKGDPVIIQYKSSSLGKDTIIKLVDKKSE